MTIDSVVQKTGISLAVVIVTAAATWIVTADIITSSDRRRWARSTRPDDRQRSALRAVDGQLVQAGGQPRPGARLLRLEGVALGA